MIIGTLFEQSWISLPHAKYQCIPGRWFMRRTFWRFIKSFYSFAPYWAPIRAGPFIWTNLNPHPVSMFPAKIGWNWPSGSWEEVIWTRKLTPDKQRMLRHAICSHGLRPGELKMPWKIGQCAHFVARFVQRYEIWDHDVFGKFWILILF